MASPLSNEEPELCTNPLVELHANEVELSDAGVGVGLIPSLNESLDGNTPNDSRRGSTSSQASMRNPAARLLLLHAQPVLND